MSKTKKKKELKPLNRRIANLMIEIQDELWSLESEVERAEIQNSKFAKMIVMETKECLERFANKIKL
jgi:hypothetical protein